MIAQVNLEGQWWAADVGFGSQVPRQPVPLRATESDAAPRQTGSWRPPDAGLSFGTVTPTGCHAEKTQRTLCGLPHHLVIAQQPEPSNLLFVCVSEQTRSTGYGGASSAAGSSRGSHAAPRAKAGTCR